MKEGDKVSFVTTKQVKGGFHITAKEGVIDEIYPNGYDIKMKNGRIFFVPSQRVRPLSEDNALTEVIRKLVEIQK